MRALFVIVATLTMVACNNSSSSPTPPSASPGEGAPETKAPEAGAYEPCAGKACGDACTLCAPGDPDCMETMEVKACNPEGRCVAQTDGLCP